MNKYILLDVLLCSIAEYFYELCRIFLGSGAVLAREIKLTEWSMAGNLSNRSFGVQIPRNICTRLKRSLYSAKCSWIINIVIYTTKAAAGT